MGFSRLPVETELDHWNWAVHTRSHQIRHHPAPLCSGSHSCAVREGLTASCRPALDYYNMSTVQLVFFIKSVLMAKGIDYISYLFSLLPFPVSLNPLAKGLLSIFSCVIFRRKKMQISHPKNRPMSSHIIKEITATL